jgi:hypothetical protein
MEGGAELSVRSGGVDGAGFGGELTIGFDIELSILYYFQFFLPYGFLFKGGHGGGDLFLLLFFAEGSKFSTHDAARLFD